jgi:hypothetical protein
VHHLIFAATDACDDGIGLDPIIFAIQELIASRHDVLIVCQRFELLRIRYNAAKIPKPIKPWNGRLSYDFQTLDDVSSMSPNEIATAWTEKHIILFAALRDDDFPESKRLDQIGGTWDQLVRDAQECALVGDSIVDKLAHVEKVRDNIPCLALSD